MATDWSVIRGISAVGAKFLTVGAISTLIEIAAFNALVYMFGFETIPAKIAASLIALVNAYFGSRLWTFRGRRGRGRLPELVRFLGVNFACAVLGATIIGIVSSVLDYRLGLDGPLWLNLANVFSIGVVVVVRFVLYHLWVFPHVVDGESVEAPGPVQPWHIAAISRLSSTSLRSYAVIGAVAVAFIVTLVLSPLRGFVDEYDTILGGWLLLNRGELPYVGFFSHHMPLAYLAAAPMVAITGTDLIAFRLLFATLMFLWLILIFTTTRRYLGTIGGLALVVGMTLFQSGVMANMLVAETLIAYAVVHAVVLIGGDLWGTRRVASLRDVAVIAVIGAVPVLSSLSYAFVSATIYVWFGVVYLITLRRKERSTKNFAAVAAKVIGVLLIPYVLAFGYLAVTGSGGAFINQAFLFNTRYYSQFIPDVSTGVVQTALNNVSNFIGDFRSALLGGSSMGEILATVLAWGLVVSLAALVLLGYQLTAAFTALLVVFGAYRGNTPIDAFTNLGGRSMTYAALAVVVAVLAGSLALRTLAGRPALTQRIVAVIALASSLALIAAPVAAGLRADRDTVILAAAGAVQTIQTGGYQDEQARVANLVLDHDDYYFVGPFDFYTQLYLDGRRSSLYTFFLPWHGACSECTSDLRQSLERDKPVVVIWDADYELWGHPAAEYAPEVAEILSSEYFQVADARASDLYFLKEQRALITDKLANGGVDASTGVSR